LNVTHASETLELLSAYSLGEILVRGQALVRNPKAPGIEELRELFHLLRITAELGSRSEMPTIPWVLG
jgi:hypothetical protein